jgi:DGQHR domain-containing protein
MTMASTEIELSSNTEELIIPDYQITADADLTMFVQQGNEGIGLNYSVKLTYQQCADFFELEDRRINTRQRLQRDADKGRVSDIVEYLINRNNTFFPSAILVVTELDMELLHADANLYRAILKANTDRLFIDGQGRLAGIKEAILLRPELANYTLDVKIIVVKTETIRESAKFVTQLFSDLHLGLKKPNSSQSIYFDSESSSSRLACQLLETTSQIGVRFADLVAVNGKLQTGQIYMLANLVDFIAIMTGVSGKKSLNDLLDDESHYALYMTLITQYIGALFKVLPFEQTLVQCDSNKWKEELKSNVFYTAIGFKALAYIGRSLVEDALHNEMSSLDMTALSGLANLPYTRPDDQLWIDKEIYQVIQNKLKIVKSSEKRLAGVVCQKIRLLPCAAIV